MPIISTTSVYVDDQDKALAFYTEKLGFVAKTDVTAGEYRWLTVVSDVFPAGVELVLEPDALWPCAGRRPRRHLRQPHPADGVQGR